MCQQAWNLVKGEMIKNCFRKAGVIIKGSEEGTTDEAKNKSALAIEGWKDIISESTVSFEEFINADEDISMCPSLLIRKLFLKS